MRRTLTALGLLLGLPFSVAASLWDRDTPASEAKGMPDVVAALTCQFERNPPLFYEMRLVRTTAQLQSHPEDLAAYDDAGVACDCLGRGDEAIAWMEKKRTQLERLDASLPGVKEQRYRYHANLGTFLVHRWVREGADRSQIDEVKAARDEIAKALQINPNAQFGREKYQLQAIDWIIDPPKVQPGKELPNILGWDIKRSQDQPDPQQADDALRGLVGLVVLGNEWENVDVIRALIVALQTDMLVHAGHFEGGQTTVVVFALLRCRELIDAGKRSILPDAPQGEALKKMLRPSSFVRREPLLVVQGQLLYVSVFKRLRAEADAWHKSRTEFMTRRLNEGRHPDNDPNFWDGFTEQSTAELPTESVPDSFDAGTESRQTMAVFVAIGLAVFAAGMIVGSWAVRSVKARYREAHQRRAA